MTFEEFFKKKKIDLVALKKSEPGLFAEFKTHYEQMGEKSFDHTKKYWFNKLRRQFVPPVEIKTEKVKIENPIAEQTVTEALIDEGSAPAPQLGFKPKFRAVALPKPVEENNEDATVPDKAIAEEKPVEDIPKPKLGFTPKFKSANVPKKVEEVKEEPKAPDEKVDEEKPETTEPTRLGFKPKYKAANLPKPTIENVEETIVPEKEIQRAPSPESPPPKLGFKPKFKPSVTPKPPNEGKAEDLIPPGG